MSEPLPSTNAESPPSTVPVCDPDAMRDAQVGYHRMLLGFSLALLCACVILPAPDDRGHVRLPGSDTALPTLCMLKRQCGVDCPGCGLTRCFLSMTHARVASAWRYHSVGVVLFVVAMAQIPYRVVQIRRLRHGRPQLSHWTLTALPWLLAVAILGQWVLRITGILIA